MVDEAKYTGCMVGLAVGDALGYPAEFRRREQILRGFGPRGIEDFVGIFDERFSGVGGPMILGTRHPPGTYTDDTQMTLAVAQGLLEAGPEAPLDDLMGAVARFFVNWSKSPTNDRAPGGTCMTGCGNLERGVPWREAGVASSKGCGSAMRVAPIGLVYQADHDRLLEVARASSILTHGHDAGVEGAAAAALLVALALEGAEPEEMYRAVMEACGDRSPDFAGCMEKLPSMLDVEPARALSSAGLGEAWVAEEAVASALYCVWRHPDDFEAAVLEATNTDGDSDSIACIAGSIVGARLGLEAIPAKWRQGVEDSELLHRLGHQLFEARLGSR